MPVAMDRSVLLRARLPLALLATPALLWIYSGGGAGWWLGLVALVPWLLALEGTRGWRGALLAGWAVSVAFTAFVLGWFGAAIGSYTGLGPMAGFTALVLAAPLLQPQWIAFALVHHFAGRRHGDAVRALAAAAAWVACEALWPKLLGDTLGHGLLPATWLRQAADLGGAALLTFLLLLVNQGIALAIGRRRQGARAFIGALAPVAVLLAFWSGYGAWRLATLPGLPEDAPVLRVALVQANLGDYAALRTEHGTYGAVRHVLDTHYALSWSARREHGADVLLWPETVYPTTFGSPRSEDGAALDAEIQSFVNAIGLPLVFGTYDLDEAGEYNAAVFLEPGRGRLATYRKTHPFPLTEYVPAWLDGPVLRRWLPWAGSWQRGDGARVLPLRTGDGRQVEVAPLICLDDVRPALAIDGARLGAQALVGLSNDAWFSRGGRGARLHLAVAAFRSIETRLPQLRVTTTGLSAFVDTSGEVLAVTPANDQAVLTVPLPVLAPPPTLAVLWGDWVGRVAALALALWALARGLQAWSRRQPLRRTDDRVLLLAPAARVALGALQALAGLGLAWLALDMALRVGWQVATLGQLQVFTLAVLLPASLAWALRAWFGARWQVQGESLLLTGRREQVSIPLASIVGLRPWRLPWPGSGVALRLASGQDWRQQLQLADPVALLAALAAAGSPARLDGPRSGADARRDQIRASGPAPWLDRPWLKFGLFPLLPAAIAFRLHQVITFGGAFGEAQVHGWGAWWLGLGIWWLSWMLGLALVAAALRVLVEAATALALRLAPGRAAGLRSRTFTLARALYFLGIPAWLGWRLLVG
ncbi:apolipoprotein N-acyltransferase [Arenimonas caeni]|uniref:Apolipoprotein N-acyltransferase n=2 Tax=Arenimonas caeni TaxID=2058085 RepID=A0A2P6M8Y9_9GAMM|nr:apolipoprotein N-acyltransferase [Arenimonas caeni]